MIGISKNLYKANVKAGGGAVVYDADAQAYFTANTAITSAADKNAINTFYLGLKSDGIYTKIKAMYLPIWGSAASCKWNLVNPLDTNAAFRLTFSTGWTFSSGGMQGNGTSYARTYFTPSVNALINSSHGSAYSRTNNDGFYYEFGAFNQLGSSGGFGLLSRITNINYAYSDRYPNSVADSINYSNTDSRGFFMFSRTASNVTKSYKNGNLAQTSNLASINRTSLEVYLGAYNKDNPNGISGYSNRQYSFFTIGDGLTDTEATNFYTRVQTLMTYFGINV